MKHLKLLPLCVLLVGYAVAADNMTHEETVVRTAYAKLSYAVDLNTAYLLTVARPDIDSATLAREVDGRRLSFSLSNFKVGNLSDLSIAKYSDALGQYPDGQDIIEVTLSQPQFHEKTLTLEMDLAQARWAKGPQGTPPSQTVEELMPIVQAESGLSGPLVRYCRFTVTARLAGRSRVYEAAFLFTATGQVDTSDAVVGLGGGPLRYFITHPVYPTILLRSSLPTRTPALRPFLESAQRTESTCGDGDVCCDLASLRCGLPSAELRRVP